jgi:hypothetical protein
MKNDHILLCIFCSLFLFGCQDDSNYLVGKYHVTITTELSSCGAEFFTLSEPFLLPTSHLAGHRSSMEWRIQRVGITGSGSEKIQLELVSGRDASVSLILTGTLGYPWWHVETSRPFTSDFCDVQRVILIAGQFKETGLYGTITTILSSIEQPEACLHRFPPGYTCKFDETFVGVPIGTKAQ